MSDVQPRSILPAWARTADAATLLILALAISVFLFGGFRTRLVGYRVSVTSAERLVLLAFAIGAVRHLIIRRPALPVAVVRGAINLWRSPSPAISIAARVGLVSRLVVLFVGLLSVSIIGFPIAQTNRVSSNEFVNLSARWDSGWYLGIASEGYSAAERENATQNIAFFPAFPFLMWLGGFLVGARQLMGVHQLGLTLTAGVAISVLAFTWAMVYFYRLAREELGEDPATAAVVLLAAYPFAVFFSAAYTESLFLLTTIAAIYHMRHGQLIAAGAWGLVAGLTRPNGCFLSVALAMIAISRFGPSWAWLASPGWGKAASVRPVAAGDPAGRRLFRTGLALTAAAMPGIGMLLYSGFIYLLTGDPFRWAAAHTAWGRDYRAMDALYGPAFDMIGQVGLLDALGLWQGTGMNFLGATFALLLLIPVTLRLGPMYGAFTALNLIPPMLFGGWLSMGRITSVLFPIFLYLAIAVPRHQRIGLAAGFAMMQGFVAAVFFTWRPIN